MTSPNLANAIVQIPVPMQNVISAAIAGVEGGIGYWARVEGYAPKETSPGRTVANTRGGFDYYPATMELPWFTVVDVEATPGERPQVTYIVDNAALVRGLRIMAEKYPRHAAAILEDKSDAETGDVLIQLATLGDIVYG